MELLLALYAFAAGIVFCCHLDRHNLEKHTAKKLSQGTLIAVMWLPILIWILILSVKDEIKLYL